MREIIGIDAEGIVEFHAGGGIGDYATLCGLDGTNTSASAQTREPVPARQKITCGACKQLFIACNSYKASDFE